jgi:aryl-alcohol dehydrogenase-like predicted oxidoreductase
MEYTRLGRSGLKVSRVGLGCMSYGQAASGMHQWTLDEDAAAPFFQQAVELGVTFWDTANVYQGGTSEELAAPSTSTPAAKTLFCHQGPREDA